MCKKKYLLALLLVAIACKSTTNSVTQATASIANVSVVKKVTSASSVEESISFLASDKLNGREAGTEGINTASLYIENIFKKNDVRPYFETYYDTLTNFDKPTYNVVGFVEGNDPQLKNEFIIIGAHYDHIGIVKSVEEDKVANGANDNASGTSAVIEFAKYFGAYKTNKRSLLFVLFSAEEKGLLGSKHLAEKLKNKNFSLYTMINFEMIGVPMQREKLTYLTGYKESNMAEKMNLYAGKDVIGFLPKASEYSLFKRSDNYPFYKVFKVPAQTISTFDFENYAYYHHVDDEISKMDFEHIAIVINEMIPVLEKISNTPTKEIKMNTP